MKGMILLLRSINILSAGAMAGGQLFPLLTILPAMRAVSPARAVEAHQELLDVRADRYLRPTGMVSGVAALLLLLLGVRGRRRPLLLTLAGLAGTLGVMVVSMLVEFPINRTIRAWSRDAIPADYAHLRQRWDRGHTFRCACALLAFICYTAAGLADGDRP